MATSHTPPRTLGDVLLVEVHPAWSKGEGVIVAGNHAIGTVLARVSGKYQPIDFAGTGNAKKAVAVLGESIHTTGDTMADVVIERGAVLARDQLVWPDTATDVQKAQAVDELAALGIVAREQI